MWHLRVATSLIQNIGAVAPPDVSWMIRAGSCVFEEALFSLHANRASEGKKIPPSRVLVLAMVREVAPRRDTSSNTLPPLIVSPSTSKKVVYMVLNAGIVAVVPACTKLKLSSAPESQHATALKTCPRMAPLSASRRRIRGDDLTSLSGRCSICTGGRRKGQGRPSLACGRAQTKANTRKTRRGEHGLRC